ncbi:MAG: signal peptidase I [Chloroflexota bacterium]
MWKPIIATVVASGLGMLALLRFRFTITTVRGESMSPALEEGDRLLSLNFWPHSWLRRGQIVTGNSDKLLLPIEAFEQVHNDVAVVSFEDETIDTKFIKRIVGLPGDTVCVPLTSLHVNLQTALQSQADAHGNLVWEVPDRHCFLRGDGTFSVDSLLLGPIPLAALRGIVLLKLPNHAA